MGIQTSEWEDRVIHWVKTLEKDLYLPLAGTNFFSFYGQNGWKFNR